MVTGFDDFQKLGKDQVDVAIQSVDALSKGMQALATEAADYSKRAFDEGTVAVEKLLSARSLDNAVQAQSDYVRTAYEGYVGQISKVGVIVADMAKDAYRPYEALLGRYGK